MKSWTELFFPESRAAGRLTALLVAPHVVLGTWLLVVPDHVAFTVTQVVTLIHVFLGLLTIPVAVFAAVAHARRIQAVRGRKGRVSRASSWVLSLAGVAAIATGGIVLWDGDIVPSHQIHSVAGLVVGAVLVVHLWTGRRRKLAFAAGLLFLVASVGAAATRTWLPAPPLEPVTEPFAFSAKRSDLFESAETCRQCHETQYADWSHSTHARTLEFVPVRESLEDRHKEVGFDITAYAEAIDGKRSKEEAFLMRDSCERCHMPTTFYGDDRQMPLEATGIAAEGVTCSFCHTIRGVYEGSDRKAPLPADFNVDDWSKILPRFPYYVSSPESVRSYLGARSGTRVGRWLANNLIRWRPDVHRADMSPAVLKSPVGCLPCHSNGDLDQLDFVPQKTYIAWENSHYSTDDPSTTVTCQDCHMVNELTGRKNEERGRVVPWGPERVVFSHRLLGGNRALIDELDDVDHARREHLMNTKVATLEIVGAQRDGDLVHVDVEATSRLVGHLLPSVAAQNRWFWISVSALDSEGRKLGETKAPARPPVPNGESALIFRCIEPPRADCDTVLKPGETRRFTTRLPLPSSVVPATLVASLYSSFDPEVLTTTTATWPLPLPETR